MHRIATLSMVLFTTLCLCSISCSEDPEPMSNERLRELASEINDLFVSIRISTGELSASAGDLLQRMDTIEHGIYPAGRYSFYQGSVYYTPEDDGGCAVWASGFVPVDDRLKLKISRLEHLEADIIKAATSSSFVIQSYFLIPESVGMIYPYFDTVALLPPGIDLSEVFLPFQAGDRERNPEQGPFWISPYIDASGKGYIITVSIPVNTGGVFQGVAASDVAIPPINQAFLQPHDECLFLVTQATLPVAINQACSAMLPIEGLGEYYYLESVSEDVYASDQFLLSNSSSPDIRTLADQIGRQETFTISIEGSEFSFDTQPLPEVDWTLVRARAI